MKIISTRSNSVLSQKIASILMTKLVPTEILEFPDTEIYVEIKESIRREEVYIIAGFSSSSNKNTDLMELMLLIDAVRRSNPLRITIIFPYYPYARQDRRTNRSPISAKVIAGMLCHAGINSVVCMDLHSTQTQAFFTNNVTCEHMSALKTMYDHLKSSWKSYSSPNWDTVVSSDIGGTGRVRYFANLTDLPMAIIDKRRPKPGVSEVMNIVGDVEGKRCVLVDDMIDGGGTLIGATNALLDNGAKSVDALCVHGVLSGNARAKLENSNIDRIFISDSIGQSMASSKITIVSVSNLLAETITRLSKGQSLKALVSD
jgi:ribose-phosphate pyrophosphokinase